jgi:hypothetical protein
MAIKIQLQQKDYDRYRKLGVEHHLVQCISAQTAITRDAESPEQEWKNTLCEWLDMAVPGRTWVSVR